MHGNQVRSEFISRNLKAISDAEYLIRETVKKRRTIFACGNGGSASDAAHFVAELTGKYKSHRPGYPATSLGTNQSEITAISNDFGYKESFSRPFKALATPGSLLIAISTSGNSSNILDVVSWALHGSYPVITLLGKSGGTLGSWSGPTHLIVPSDDTALIQECHISVLHYFASLVDQEFE